MKKISATILGLTILGGCGRQESSHLSASTRNATKSRADIAAELAAKPEGDNVVWSTASLDALLALVGLGFDDQRRDLLTTYLGTSVKEKAKTSALLNIKREGLIIQSANNIWTRHDFTLKSEYKTDLANYFNGLEPAKMDVYKSKETAAEINSWISKNTNELIKDAVTEEMITPDLASLLANALYFKGDWKEQFDSKFTENLDFQTVNKNSGKVVSKKVATMQKRGSQLQVGEQAGPVYTVRLPYKGDTHAMYIAFAKQPANNAGHSIVETKVDASKDVKDVYRQYIVEGKAFSADYSRVMEFDLFTMPKFTIESSLKSIHANLSDAGYDSLFVQGALSRMSADPRAQLSFILQKAKIIVNEEGSEAAAVTIGGVRTTSIHASNHLKIDGPFAYAIRDDKNGITLFEGMVRSPESN